MGAARIKIAEKKLCIDVIQLPLAAAVACMPALTVPCYRLWFIFRAELNRHSGSQSAIVPQMSVRTLSVCLLSLLLLGATASSDDRPVVGSTRDDVLVRFGPPTSRMVTGTTEVLNFPNLRLVLERGVVIEVSPLAMPLAPPKKSPSPAIRVAPSLNQNSVARQPVPPLVTPLRPRPQPAPTAPVAPRGIAAQNAAASSVSLPNKVMNSPVQTPPATPPPLTTPDPLAPVFEMVKYVGYVAGTVLLIVIGLRSLVRKKDRDGNVIRFEPVKRSVP